MSALFFTLVVILLIAVIYLLCMMLKKSIEKSIAFERERDQALDDVENLKAVIEGLKREQDTEANTEHPLMSPTRLIKRDARPSSYQAVFEYTNQGQAILDDLVHRFSRNTFVHGGHEAERESCYNAGKHSVINYILAQITKANDPTYTEAE